MGSHTPYFETTTKNIRKERHSSFALPCHSSSVTYSCPYCHPAQLNNYGVTVCILNKEWEEVVCLVRWEKTTKKLSLFYLFFIPKDLSKEKNLMMMLFARIQNKKMIIEYIVWWRWWWWWGRRRDSWVCVIFLLASLVCLVMFSRFYFDVIYVKCWWWRRSLLTLSRNSMRVIFIFILIEYP